MDKYAWHVLNTTDVCFQHAVLFEARLKQQCSSLIIRDRMEHRHKSHDGSGWCWYTNIKGVYWWDPWQTIYSIHGSYGYIYIYTVHIYIYIYIHIPIYSHIFPSCFQPLSQPPPKTATSAEPPGTTADSATCPGCTACIGDEDITASDGGATAVAVAWRRPKGAAGVFQMGS